MKSLKSLFCALYSRWMATAVQPGSWLVRAMDATITSQCKYCMAARAVILTAGVFLLYFLWWLGALLIFTAVALTWGERYWLCTPPQGETK